MYIYIYIYNHTGSYLGVGRWANFGMIIRVSSLIIQGGGMMGLDDPEHKPVFFLRGESQDPSPQHHPVSSFRNSLNSISHQKNWHPTIIPVFI